MGARVTFSGGKPKVTDGPFTEAKVREFSDFPADVEEAPAKFRAAGAIRAQGSLTA
jgi:hypothetical protein